MIGQLILKQGRTKGPDAGKDKVQFVQFFRTIGRRIRRCQHAFQQSTEHVNMGTFDDRCDLLESTFHRFQTHWNVFVEENGQIGSFRLQFTCFDPGGHLRIPAEIGRIDVENTGPRDGGRCGRPEMADFEEQTHGGIQRDTFVTGQCQDFVVVHDRIQRFDPHRIDITIEHDPFRSIRCQIGQVSHDGGEESVLPFSRCRVDDAEQFVVCHRFWIQINGHRLPFLIVIRSIEHFPDLRFARAGIAHDEDRVTHFEQFLQLNHFEDERIFRLQFQIDGRLFDQLFKIKISTEQMADAGVERSFRSSFDLPFSWHVQSRKEITDQTHEDGHVIGDNLGNVEITQSSHQHLIFGSTRIRTTQCTGDDQDRFDRSQTPIVVILDRPTGCRH